MRDSTRDIEVWVAHVDPGAAEEDQAYAQYEEAEGVYGDNIFQTDVHVVTGEHFAIFVELGDLFDFHDNKVLKIQVSIDGGAVNICQYLDAKDHYQGPLIKKIREVRARVTDEYLQENGKETELWWCGLVFGELQALQPRTFPVTLPAWGDIQDHDTITVRLELGHLDYPAHHKDRHRSSEAYETPSLKLTAWRPAQPVKHRSIFHTGKQPAVTFRFPYFSTDKVTRKDYETGRSRRPKPPKHNGSVASKLGKRSRDESDAVEEVYAGPKPEITFKKVKVESTTVPQPGVVNPQWEKQFGGGRL